MHFCFEFQRFIFSFYLYNPIKHIFISSTQAAGGLNELKHRTDVTNAEYLMCDVQFERCVSTLSSSSRIADISLNFSWWCWLDSLTKCYLYSTLPSCMSNKPWWLTYHLLELCKSGKSRSADHSVYTESTGAHNRNDCNFFLSGSFPHGASLCAHLTKSHFNPQLHSFYIQLWRQSHQPTTQATPNRCFFS